jgi:amidase
VKGYEELAFLDATDLAKLIRKKEINAQELIEFTIQKIEKINPALNAVIHKLYDQARETARTWTKRLEEDKVAGAVFAGVPFLLKDLYAECQGTPFHEGCRAVKGYVSKLDTELVRRQKAAGLIIVGKTNTPEFGLLPTTEPDLYGPTKNPWNPTLTPGGSSGGSAAAVAAGIVPLAHGNDGGGSIRIPASCCGLFGLKPTRGRNPLGPLFGDGISGLIAEHGVTRTVRDSAVLLDATSGPAPGDPYWAPPKERPYLEEINRKPGRLKIGVLQEIPADHNDESKLHPDCEQAVKAAARLCQELGHTVEIVSPSVLGQPGIITTFGSAFSCYTGQTVAYWERELGKKIEQSDLEPITWGSYQAGLRRTGPEYLVAIEEIQRFSRKIALWYDEGRFDLLLSPTMAIPPTPLGAFQIKAEDPRGWLRVTNAFVAFTRVQNMTGQPAMSVPLYWNEANIPIGVQFAGRFGDEATLFRLAAQLEEARPWKDRRPPVSA